MTRRWVAVMVIALLATSALAWRAEPASTASTHDGGPQRVMVFPVAGEVTFTDTFGASRDGGRRRHEGQDLLGAKMTPLVATVDGEVTKVEFQSRYGTAAVIEGDDGWSYRYLHVNNDSLGTDDGRGAYALAFGPGIRAGVRVKAGQLLGFLGDSGNAEGTHPHLHFELRNPDGKAVNAYNSLLTATRISKPRDLPDGYELPPLGTAKATPSQQAPRSTTTTGPNTTTTTGPRSTTTTRPKSTTTTAKPPARRGATTTTRPKSTTTTARPKSTTTTTRPKSTTTTTRRTTTTTR